ncbi:amylo-alpha-1,6-glucosidase [Vibrio sp. D404a]|uniref:amylo-alpha-1,6-glucosidase n=1 Tax=unclassified Vibrio TaxID=2614977 RepID=UPI002557633D|nr:MULTISPECIES: amylo-alpha-1,6-glucosidase [unclassified Vibrio]MDK9736755.1 amylo-alpha-1,6-glucosidase [Vibrio sp. D404a]MDK9795827.1 amylo-alpha-1,6-glucosidase [Vibrio sp. D449a]
MQIPTLYLKGTFNGWGLDTPLTAINSHTLQATLCLSTDQYRFKISDLDGTKQWTLSGHPTKAVECALENVLPLVNTQGIGNDLLFTPQAAGHYTVTIDLASDTPAMAIEQGEQQSKAVTQRPPVDIALEAIEAEQPEWRKPSFALEANDLFAQLAITETTPFTFVFGDNVDGYYHGTTHTFINSGKYRHHQGWLFGGFASFINRVINDKTQAKQACLMPYGLEHHYPSSQDCLSLMQEKRQVAISVKSDTEQTLNLLPELNIPSHYVQVHQSSNHIILELDDQVCPEGCPKFVSLIANHAVQVEELSSEQVHSIAEPMQLSSNNINLLFSTKEEQTELALYISFAHQRQEAESMADYAAEKGALVGHQQAIYQFLCNNYLWTNDVEYNKAVMWARLASRTFVSHEFGTGIWAGLPWFKDCWGRDTFIALSGTSLVNGFFEEAKAIIENFAAMQMTDESSVNFGRIPNRVTSKTNIIYNTTDGTPWMIREALEYINYSGDEAFAKAIYPALKRFISGVEKHYLAQDGLMSHRHPDTWMDAKIDGAIPWSPRGPKANDIQALWFESLHCAMALADLVGDDESKQQWQTRAAQVKESFISQFWNPEKQCLADHLAEGDKPDYSVRPNQLMTISIPQQESLTTPDIEQYIVKNSVDKLLFPWGICSLQQEHIDFHPYHDNQSQYHKDAAYHNGTIWGWNAGFTVTALTRYKQQDFSYQLSKNLAKQILNQGCRGTMSENLDAYQHDNNKLVESGTFAQAWSVSEYARNAQQDYLGYRPQLLENRINIAPKLPQLWTQFNASLPYGDNKQIVLRYSSDNEIARYTLTSSEESEAMSDIELVLALDVSNSQYVEVRAPLAIDLEIIVNQESGEVTTNTSKAVVTSHNHPNYTLLEGLEFAQPDIAIAHNSILNQDYLRNKREKQEFAVAKD